MYVISEDNIKMKQLFLIVLNLTALMRQSPWVWEQECSRAFWEVEVKDTTQKVSGCNVLECHSPHLRCWAHCRLLLTTSTDPKVDCLHSDNLHWGVEETSKNIFVKWSSMCLCNLGIKVKLNKTISSINWLISVNHITKYFNVLNVS